jgi:hypothetical protein
MFVTRPRWLAKLRVRVREMYSILKLKIYILNFNILL